MRGVRSLDLGSYARAFYLLVRFPQVMLGPLLVAIAQVLLFTIMPTGTGFAAAANSGIAGLFAQLLASFGLAVGIVVADSAWRYNRAPFDDAWDQSRRRGGDILMSALGVGFVTYVASAIGGIIPGFGSIILYVVATYFMIYAIPAAAIGGIPGGASLQISIERARASVPPTLIVTAVYLFAYAIATTLLSIALDPFFALHVNLTSGPVSSLIVAFIKAPIGGYVALMLAKTYENVSYGRLR